MFLAGKAVDGLNLLFEHVTSDIGILIVAGSRDRFTFLTILVMITRSFIIR